MPVSEAKKVCPELILVTQKPELYRRAKIACKMDKPDGHTVWHPQANRNRLYDLPFDDIPGIGGRMQMRLWNSGIQNMGQLMNCSPNICASFGVMSQASGFGMRFMVTRLRPSPQSGACMGSSSSGMPRP